MAEERKRIAPIKAVKQLPTRVREAEQPKVVPKKAPVKPVVKKVEPKVEEADKSNISSFIIDESESKPKKPTTDKYLRLAEDADIEEKKQFADRVNKGELSRAHYAIDNDKGYHYFLIVKK